MYQLHPSLRFGGGIQATDHGIYITARPAGDVAPSPEATMSATHMQIGFLAFLAGIGAGYVFFKRGV